MGQGNLNGFISCCGLDQHGDINKKKKISLTRRQKYFINRGFTFFDELKDYCEQPAKYGFHATLKAPFRLKRNVKTKNF